MERGPFTWIGEEEVDLLRGIPSKIDLGDELALTVLTELGELLVEEV